jgi:hypothetical protein
MLLPWNPSKGFNDKEYRDNGILRRIGDGKSRGCEKRSRLKWKHRGRFSGLNQAVRQKNYKSRLYFPYGTQPELPQHEEQGSLSRFYLRHTTSVAQASPVTGVCILVVRPITPKMERRL